ncbi:MAG: thymidine phosphorylase [Bacilli bacterium]|jgi:pyrimidine-nucleoside phosphorylase
MTIEEVIEHKRDKKVLTREEIHFFIKGYVADEIKDYQASALLMAIYINGMDKQEIADLTEEMRLSGDVWHLDDIPGLIVDKHSTGGVGDKVSLILGPMIASCGAKLAKMSGRGLGHTGGTLDKMESIPGMNIYEDETQFKRQINEIGMAIIGQNEHLDPADKKLYALRDVTGTVGSIPLIASSIMSKKLASGADCILLDVKYGSGAFMKTIDDAKLLAQTMVDIGKSLKKDVRAEVTDMDQPLGCAVGNNLEIKEVIQTLHGNGPKDLNEICLSSGALLLQMAKIYPNLEDGRAVLIENIKNGRAFEKFKEFVKAQNGDVSYIDNPSKFKMAKYVIDVKSKYKGTIKKIDALAIGLGSMHLGGGREKMDDVIDYSAGIVLNKKIGDHVEKGETLCRLYTDHSDYKEVYDEVLDAFMVSPNKVELEKSITKLLIE